MSVDAKKLIKVLEGMLEIAELAMPDSYYASDSRVRAAKQMIKKLKTDVV